MIDIDLEKALNQIVNLLVSMEKRLKNIELELKNDDKKRLLNG
jgi:Skp family chaperone for outer membrane proteins